MDKDGVTGSKEKDPQSSVEALASEVLSMVTEEGKK